MHSVMMCHVTNPIQTIYGPPRTMPSVMWFLPVKGVENPTRPRSFCFCVFFVSFIYVSIKAKCVACSLLIYFCTCLIIFTFYALLFLFFCSNLSLVQALRLFSLRQSFSAAPENGTYAAAIRACDVAEKIIAHVLIVIQFLHVFTVGHEKT